MGSVFISYSRKDEATIKRICEALDKAEVEYWIDVRDIKPGQNWDSEIEAALDKASHLLLIVSRNSLESAEVTAEWRSALNAGKTVIPVRIEDIELPSRLYILQRFDWHTSSSDDEKLSHLLELLPLKLPAQFEQTLNDEKKADDIYELLKTNPNFLTVLGMFSRVDYKTEDDRFEGVEHVSSFVGTRVPYHLFYLSNPYAAPTDKQGIVDQAYEQLTSRILKQFEEISEIYAPTPSMRALMHIKILRGRRSDYDENQHQHRHRLVKELSDKIGEIVRIEPGDIEIVSYSRVLERHQQ